MSRAETSRGLPLWLIALFFASFAIGTDDFVIAGVLPGIAGDLGVSEAVAGQLVTVFAVGYAATAPILAVVTARWPRRATMIGASLLFAGVNLLAALAPDYPVLLMLLNPAVQIRLLSLAGNAGTEVVALNSSAMYVGISVAGGLGGAVLTQFGPGAVPLAAGILGACALLTFAVAFRAFRTAPAEPS